MRLSIGAALLLAGGMAQAAPLYPDAIDATDIAFFKVESGSSFTCLRPLPTAARDMPGGQQDGKMLDGVAGFEILFLDGVETVIWLHPSFSSATAELYATKVGEAIGRLPSFMRKGLDHIVVRDGAEPAFADPDGRYIVVFSNAIDARLIAGDLEAELFQATTKAVLETSFGKSDQWRAAQAADGDFVTQLAADDPDKEDLSESALFAYALLITPGQLPVDVGMVVQETIPHRLEALGELFEANMPIFDPSIDLPGCLP